MRPFQSTFDNASGGFAVRGDKLAADNRRTDCFRGVDNFLDTRHTEGDVHGSYTGEVESFQCHLGARLPDGLCTDGADG